MFADAISLASRLRLPILLITFGLVGLASDAVADDVAAWLGEAQKLVDQLEDKSNSETQRAELKKQVRALLVRSFEKRQADQRKQMEDLEQKLREVRQRWEARQEIAERIVDRKLEDLISGVQADWEGRPAKSRISFDWIEAGDIVALYIEGVLPFNPPGVPPSPPPVNQTTDGIPYLGFPLTVQSDGMVALPLVDAVRIAGLSVREAEQAIAKRYIDADILRREKARPIISIIKRSGGSAVDTNSSSGQAAAPPARQDLPESVASTSPSPLDFLAALSSRKRLASSTEASEFSLDEFQRLYSFQVRKSLIDLRAKSLEVSEEHAKAELRRIFNAKPDTLTADERSAQWDLKWIDLGYETLRYKLSQQQRKVDAADNARLVAERQSTLAERHYKMGARSETEKLRLDAELQKQSSLVAEATDRAAYIEKLVKMYEDRFSPYLLEATANSDDAAGN
ncbi:MAG: polysaccharide biosynthesis/export family protein [Planctomycetota bacterium]